MNPHTINTDNTMLEGKINLRKQAIKGLDTIKVLDLFAGENIIWSNISHDRYFGIEQEKDKGRNLYADNLKVIPSLDLSQFTVIDCDSYGIPYKQIKAVFDNPTLKKGTVVIYTAISNKMSTINSDAVRDFNLQNIVNKSKVLSNGLALELFYEMLRKHGINKIYEYTLKEQFIKNYGYFIV